MALKITKASFNTSATNIDNSLFEGISEVVFLGRSNVGKSSFINALTNHKGLAKSSSTPGKTRLINFFDIAYNFEDTDFKVRFVDLPGFGYARVSKSEKHEWQQNLTSFIEHRTSIKVFVHLRDARHPDLEIDNLTEEFLQQIKRPDQEIITILTKSDKLNQSKLSSLKKIFPKALYISNTKKKNIQKANQYIFDLIFPRS